MVAVVQVVFFSLLTVSLCWIHLCGTHPLILAHSRNSVSHRVTQRMEKVYRVCGQIRGQRYQCKLASIINAFFSLVNPSFANWTSLIAGVFDWIWHPGIDVEGG